MKRGARLAPIAGAATMLCLLGTGFAQAQQSGIDLEKSTNGFDADTAPGPTLTVGDQVTWTYAVTNQTEGALAVTVTDSVEGVICATQIVNPNQTINCTKTGPVMAGLYMNSATAVGELIAEATSPDSLDLKTENYTDTDASHYTGEACFSTETVTGCVTGGGPECNVTAAADVTVASVGVTPPAGLSFPFGLQDLTATNCTAGFTVTFNLTYPSALSGQARYWKFGPTPSNTNPHWYELPGATISGNMATFSITDGQIGDHDLSANGTIVDPGGPALVATAPTLPAWALLSLLAAMLATGAVLLRRMTI